MHPFLKYSVITIVIVIQIIFLPVTFLFLYVVTVRRYGEDIVVVR